MGFQAFEEKQLFAVCYEVQIADDVADIVVAPAGLSAMRIDSIIISNRDGVDHEIVFKLGTGLIAGTIASITAIDGCGFNSVSPAQWDNLVGRDSDFSIRLPSGISLTAALPVAVANDGGVCITCFGGFI